jgi:hypothetical protein
LDPDFEMDLQNTIDFLRGEIGRLERVLASLEELQGAAMSAAPQKKRGGRKFMPDEERRKASERMKKYWAGRRK